MGTLRSTLSAQDLALHDVGELIPQSADLIKEDIEAGRLVVATADKAEQVLSQEFPQ